MKLSPDQSSHAGSPGSPSGSGRPAHILIAEDDARIRETLTTLIRGFGYDPVAAADGEAALAAEAGCAAYLTKALEARL